MDHLEETGVDGRIILQWSFRKWDVGIWTGLYIMDWIVYYGLDLYIMVV
jgi:hypothetical protein